MKKSLKTVLTILLITVLALVLFSCTTTALWRGQTEDTRSRDADVATVNGSEKYIVYVALDGSGNYVVKDSGTTVASYAVIGYTGLVAELVIPATYKDENLNASALSVTKVLTVPDYASYECSMNGAEYAYTGNPQLTNNPVVTSIVFGSNVTFVGAGVCTGMTNLTSAHFDHVQAGVTYTDAFFGLSVTPTFRAA